VKEAPFCIKQVSIALIIQIIQLKIAEQDSVIEFCYTAPYLSKRAIFESQMLYSDVIKVQHLISLKLKNNNKEVNHSK